MGKEKLMTTKKASDIQLLTFLLDDQEYALDINNVVQVVRMMAITRPPKAPEYVQGIFNLRGKVVPVIDIRKRCGLPAKPYDLNTQLVIAQSNGRVIALIVDTVSEVLTMPASAIEPPEQIDPDMQYLRAVGKQGNRLILVLDPDVLLSDVGDMIRTQPVRKAEAAI
jgi:purine-binding chemotaxis protein CheW